MKMYKVIYVYPLLLLVLLGSGCKGKMQKLAFEEALQNEPYLEGKPDYLSSPFLTPGDRLYMVGNQDGSFSDIGWHIAGEMGGIWLHPIKLMDGFEVELSDNAGDRIRLSEAERFTNYPMANKHDYLFESFGLKISRWQFVPMEKTGMVVAYEITNLNPEPKNFRLDFTGHADLRPTWLGERTQMNDAKDISSFEGGKLVVKDSQNSWFLTYGSNREAMSGEQVSGSFKGLGVSNKLSYAIELNPEQTTTIYFVISGSYTSSEEMEQTFSDLVQNAEQLLIEKRDYYRGLANRTKLTIPDKDIQLAFEWLKYNSDWLVQTVPEIGTGIVAGIPDYPWWFGVDSEYALKGYMAIGQQKTVDATIQLLDSVSNAVNGNGKIIHEMSSNGAVFNPGNINETPQFASLIWENYLWNGDKSFLKAYFPTIQKGLNWLVEENDTDKNGFPDGFGMMEIHGLDSEMIDVAAYTQKAFEDASKIATELGLFELSSAYASRADSLKIKINREFWSKPFNSFADFRGTDQQALDLIDDAIIRADTLNKPWAIQELEATRAKLTTNRTPGLKPFVLHHNWVVNTPMEMGIADTAKALLALKTAEKFTNPFGVFVTGIDRDEAAGADDGAFQGSKVFSYTGAVMTLPTGVQVIAENNYNRPDKALEYLQKMTKSFSFALPGSMYEVSPDYGMMTQAWNIYGYAYPIVRQFFGIHPMASQKRITISPNMPTNWNEATLENVKVSDNEISVYYKRLNDGRIHLKVEQSDPEWQIIVPLAPEEAEIIEIIAGELTTDDSGQIIAGNSEGALEIKCSKVGR